MLRAYKEYNKYMNKYIPFCKSYSCYNVEVQTPESWLTYYKKT